MITSRGGVTGGLTIADALREFGSRGYVGQFAIRRDGLIECVACHQQHHPERVSLDAMRRVEGASDPADMVFVGALTCPECGARGTVAIPFGTSARAEDGEALRRLADHRASARLSHESERRDHSLVSDSGWLRGPDG